EILENNDVAGIDVISKYQTLDGYYAITLAKDIN
ncbi:MAG: hypothetical protein UT66_C0059G0009, partial [candidate division CPR2 bacterium GW2011_GWC1_39_9]